MKLEFAYESFIGRRDENQDVTIQVQVTNSILLLGVADGMGGVRGGKMASELTSRAIGDYINSLAIEEFHEKNLKSILKECYVQANAAISRAVEDQPQYRGMGSTLCLLLIFHDKYVWSNIGDSRIYKVGENSITQITEDHTYLQEHYGKDEKEIPDTIKRQYEHYLTKSLDGNMEAPDLFPRKSDYERLKPGEFFLLCSDGLILDKMGRDFNLFKSIVNSSDSVSRAVKKLIDHAFDSGSRDNIAVSLLSIRDDFSSRAYEALKSPFNKVSLYLILVIAIGFSTFFLYQAFSNNSGRMAAFENAALLDEIPQKSRKEVLEWTPLKQFDYNSPLRQGYHIHWLAYPEVEDVLRYEVLVKNEGEVVAFKELKPTARKIKVEKLNLQEDRDYSFVVNALLKDGSKAYGNSVTFIIEGQ